MSFQDGKPNQNLRLCGGNKWLVTAILDIYNIHHFKKFLSPSFLATFFRLVLTNLVDCVLPIKFYQQNKSDIFTYSINLLCLYVNHCQNWHAKFKRNFIISQKFKRNKFSLHSLAIFWKNTNCPLVANMYASLFTFLSPHF